MFSQIEFCANLLNMRLHRFYIEENLKVKNELTLRDDGFIHQLRDVFRLSADDQVILFDGQGIDYTFDIKMLSKKEINLEKVSEGKSFIPEKKVILLMSLIKKDNFELVLEKGTELGVTHFVPVITERVQKKNIDMVRANKIIKEASEQCGRGDLPTIDESIDLEDALKAYPDLIAFDISGGNLNDYKLPTNDYQLLIGPEGGWSDRELQMFSDKKMKIFKLGNTTLRAETAAIVAVSKVVG
jgi:16S rRNA (uracil1498-N3)-methyltransferase